MAAAMAAARRSVLREGVVAGLIGAVVVAVWFLVFDLARGRPFLTPGLLGGAVFRGVPLGLEITVANVLGYTLIHGLAFMAFGVVAASLLALSEREPTLFVAFVILFAAFEVFFFGVVGALGRFMLGVLVWWAVLIGNLLRSGLEITVANVLGYTLIHGLAFMAFGVVAASLLALSEREPTLFVAFVILFAAFEVFFFGVVGALGRFMLGVLVWWAVLIGNLLASL